MFGSSPSLEEFEKFRKVCKPHLTAFVGCKQANGGDDRPCRMLEVSVMTCLAAKVCPDQRADFDRCTNKSHESSTREGRLRVYDDAGKCEQQVAAMRKCLRRQGIWPKLEKHVAK